jgi:hypothetical protein
MRNRNLRVRRLSKGTRHLKAVFTAKTGDLLREIETLKDLVKSTV